MDVLAFLVFLDKILRYASRGEIGSSCAARARSFRRRGIAEVKISKTHTDKEADSCFYRQIAFFGRLPLKYFTGVSGKRGSL